MPTHLAVVGRRSSQPVTTSGGTPIDIAETVLPASRDDPTASRLLGAVDNALREMRMRQSQFPSGATSELRLGIVIRAANGTRMDVLTGSVDLRDLDLDTNEDRETILHELQALEREFLSGSS